jgi:hypothetical protein
MRIVGGRNIRMIGGRWAVTSPNQKGADANIEIAEVAGPDGTVFLEGLSMTMDEPGQHRDAIQCGGRKRHFETLHRLIPSDFADAVYIQNCQVTGLNGWNRDPDGSFGSHSDLFHNDFGLRNLFVDRIDCDSNYQGFFLRQNSRFNSPHPGELRFYNCYFSRNYLPGSGGGPLEDEDTTSFIFFANDGGEFRNNWTTRYVLENVWVNDPGVEDKRRAVRPASIAAIGADMAGEYLHWPDHGYRIVDARGFPARVRLGVPPASATPGGVAGTMLDPEFMPGLDYVSPGYVGA